MKVLKVEKMLPSGIFRRPIVCCDHREPELFELLKNRDVGSMTPPEPMQRRPLPGEAQIHDTDKSDSNVHVLGSAAAADRRRL